MTNNIWKGASREDYLGSCGLWSNLQVRTNSLGVHVKMDLMMEDSDTGILGTWGSSTIWDKGRETAEVMELGT